MQAFRRAVRVCVFVGVASRLCARARAVSTSHMTCLHRSPLYMLPFCLAGAPGDAAAFGRLDFPNPRSPASPPSSLSSAALSALKSILCEAYLYAAERRASGPRKRLCFGNRCRCGHRQQRLGLSVFDINRMPAHSGATHPKHAPFANYCNNWTICLITMTAEFSLAKRDHPFKNGSFVLARALARGSASSQQGRNESLHGHVRRSKINKKIQERRGQLRSARNPCARCRASRSRSSSARPRPRSS